MKKIKISNTVKITWNIYKNRFKEYYRLAFTNSFWIFVPVYGWAKYAAMMGLLARLTYSEVSKNSETAIEAKRHIKPRTWVFFGAGLIESIVFYSKIFLIWLPLRLVISIVITTSNIDLLFNTAFWVVVAVLCFCYYYWLLSHLFLYELPLAIDENTNANKSRDIAGKLAKKSVFKLSTMIFSFSCIFFFSSVILQIINNIINGGLVLNTIINTFDFSSLNIIDFFSQTLFFCGALFIPVLSSAISILFKLVFNSLFYPNLITTTFLFQSAILVILQIAIGALFIPFWQSLKAVTYYQLKSLQFNKES